MAGDIARLVLEIDSTGAVTGKVNLEALTRAGKESEDQVKKQKVSFTELNSALEIMRKGYELVKGAASELTKEFLSGEASQNKVEAMLKLLGDQAGVTSTQLDDLTYAMSGLTKIDDDQIQNAQAVALSFERLRGDALEPTLRVAADLSALFDGSLTSSVQALGKAADMGAEGLTVLKRSGVVLNSEVQATIERMYAAGDATAAWEATLEALRNKVGGTAAQMASENAGDIRSFQNAIDNLQESIGRLAASDLSPLIRQMTELLDTMSGSRVSLFFGGFLDAKDPVSAVASLGAAQLADLQAQIDKIQGGAGFFGGKAGWYEKLAEGPMNRLESAILGRIDQLKKQASLAEKTGLALAASVGVVPNFSALSGLAADQESSLMLDKLLKAVGNTPSYNRDFDLGVGGVGSQIAAGQDSAALGMGLDLNAKINAAADYNEGVLRIIDSTSEWNLSMQSLALTMDRVDLTMQNITAQGISRGFEDIGAALASGADAGQAFGSAMLQMGVDMAKQVGQLMITAGLKMLIETTTLNPVAWAMIAMGGGLAVAGGAVGAATRGDGAASALRSGSSSSSSGSNQSTSVVIKDYAGVGIKVTERQTPSGKELQIAVRNIVAGEIAGGGLDRAMGARFGLASPGRSAS